MTASSMTWTGPRIERLKRLWADGKSFSQIAAALGGVTRNAAGAKLHRLGLLGGKRSLARSHGKVKSDSPQKTAPRQHKAKIVVAPWSLSKDEERALIDAYIASKGARKFEPAATGNHQNIMNWLERQGITVRYLGTGHGNAHHPYLIDGKKRSEIQFFDFVNKTRKGLNLEPLTVAPIKRKSTVAGIARQWASGGGI